MKTRQELLEFLTTLSGDEVDSAVAAAEVFRRANREGVVERDGWGGPAPGEPGTGGGGSRRALERIAEAGVVPAPGGSLGAHPGGPRGRRA